MIILSSLIVFSRAVYSMCLKKVYSACKQGGRFSFPTFKDQITVDTNVKFTVSAPSGQLS